MCIFRLNGLFLSYLSLHSLDEFLLLFSELIVHELHAMNFFTHLTNLISPILRITLFLHFLLELYFSFPQANLSFSFSHFLQDIALFRLQLRDLVLKFDRLLLHLFELLFEVIFDIEIIICQSYLGLFGHVQSFIMLFHFSVEQLTGWSQYRDLLSQLHNFFVHSQFLSC